MEVKTSSWLSQSKHNCLWIGIENLCASVPLCHSFSSLMPRASCLFLFLNAFFLAYAQIPDPNYVETIIKDVDGKGNGTNDTSRTFSDGQGHKIQTQVKLNDRSGFTRVSGTEYDLVGRAVRTSKPISSTSQPQLDFIHDDIFTLANGYHNDSAYTSTQYWEDPLGRARATGAPGTNFTATSHPVKSWYFGVTGVANPASYFNADGFCTVALTDAVEQTIKQELASVDSTLINYSLVVTMDANGNYTQEIKDVFGKTLRTLSPIGGVSTNSYDVLGQMLEESPPQTSGKEVSPTTYTYTTDGKISSKTTPDAGTVYYFYDDAGRLDTVIEPDAVLFRKFLQN